jgi:YD repeat-containing protein
MSYVYDEVGNRTLRTDYNGVVTNYACDSLNRLTTIAYTTRSVTYSYDPRNNMMRVTNENGSIYIGYDNRYRVSSFSDPFFYGICYNHDPVGNRTKLSVNGARYATYTYDTVNRLTTLKDSANLVFNYILLSDFVSIENKGAEILISKLIILTYVIGAFIDYLTKAP